MIKKILLLLTFLAMFTGCSFFGEGDKAVANDATIASQEEVAEEEKETISIVSIKEGGAKFIDKSGNAIKSGGKYIADGSTKVAKSTGNFFVDCWNWTKDACSATWRWTKRSATAAWDWVGECIDSITNSDPMKKDLLKNSLKNLEEQVTKYNSSVTSSQNSLNHLYETKNKTSLTLKAVDRYTSTLGTLPLGFDAKIVSTKKDFGKYDEDLKAIQEEMKKSKWDMGDDVDNLGDAAANAGGKNTDAQTVDKAGDLMLKIASACGKEDASGMINTFKGATKLAMSVGSILAITGADMGVSATLAVAGPIVLQVVDVASNAISERTQNKKMAAEADAKSIEVATARANLETFNTKVITLDKEIAEKEANVASIMSGLLQANVTDYAKASEQEKQQVNLLIDESTKLAKLLVTTVQ